MFEQNISEQMRKRQLLTYLSEGILLPEALIKKEFENENQIKTIQYLDLNKIYKNVQIKDEEIKTTYDKNKNIFAQEFKKISYTELLPNDLTGQKEYNETYFNKINEIENSILDGDKISSFSKIFNLSLITINETNRLKKNKNGKDIEKIDEVLFSKIFSASDVNNTQLININNKYYLSEVIKVDQVTRTLDDVEIKEAIISQLKIKHIIESNTNIVKEMSEGKFRKEQFDKLGKDNNIEIKNITLSGIKDEAVFDADIIREIFKVVDGKLQLITDSSLSKNYLIFSYKTKKLPFDENIKDYKQYKSKAKLALANEIYSTFDVNINDKYNVKINQKVLSRIKNTL